MRNGRPHSPQIHHLIAHSGMREFSAFGAILLACGQGAFWFGIIVDAVKFGIHASRER